MDSKNDSWLKDIELIATEAAEQNGCLLYDVEMFGTGNGRVLRIYIDKESGIGVDECSSVSKSLNLKLDDDSEVVPGGNYSLEVSSPGLDRPLRKKWHFEKVIGKKVYIKLQQSIGSLGNTESLQSGEKTISTMKQFEEVLQAVEADDLVFKIRTHDVKIPIAKIEKSKLVFEMKTNSKKK